MIADLPWRPPNERRVGWGTPIRLEICIFGGVTFGGVTLEIACVVTTVRNVITEVTFTVKAIGPNIPLVVRQFWGRAAEGVL